MTEVGFHFNVADRPDYVCRLVRKAMRQKARVVVTGSLDTLAGLDQSLWAFDPIEFLPHVLVRAGVTVAQRLRETPVWLVESALDAGHHHVLVNLGQGVPVGFESFERVIEVVPVDEAERLAARTRWKHYASRGYAIERHEVAS